MDVSLSPMFLSLPHLPLKINTNILKIKGCGLRAEGWLQCKLGDRSRLPNRLSPASVHWVRRPAPQAAETRLEMRCRRAQRPCTRQRHRRCTERRFRSGDTRARPQAPVTWTPVEGAERHVWKDCGRPRDGRAREREGREGALGRGHRSPCRGSRSGRDRATGKAPPWAGHSSRPRLKLRHKTLTRDRDHGRGREREGAPRGGAGPGVQQTGSEKSLGPNCPSPNSRNQDNPPL